MGDVSIFLSVGNTCTRDQIAFIEALEGFLKSHGMNPKTVGRNTFSCDQPLKLIRDLMDECSGTIILAFERIHISEGLEFRGGEDEKPLRKVNLPTVWNQIEAAMAHSHRHPLLVIRESGLKEEGLLQKGYDWYVQSFKLNLANLQTPQFMGVFQDWKSKVEAAKAAKASPAPPAVPTPAFAPKEPEEPEKFTLQKWFGVLKLSHVCALITVIAGFTAAGYETGGKIKALEESQELRELRAKAASPMSPAVGDAKDEKVQYVLASTFRGSRFLDSLYSSGLNDIENRDDLKYPLPPDQIYEKANSQIAFSGVSLYRTIDQQFALIKKALMESKSVYLLVLDPMSSIVPELSKREARDIASDIRQTINVIKREKLLSHKGFKIRFTDQFPAFWGILMDGDIEPTGNVANDRHAVIRVQPATAFTTQHKGVILQWANSEKQPNSCCAYFAEQMRLQWSGAQEIASYFK